MTASPVAAATRLSGRGRDVATSRGPTTQVSKTSRAGSTRRCRSRAEASRRRSRCSRPAWKRNEPTQRELAPRRFYRIYADRCLEPDEVFAWEPMPRDEKGHWGEERSWWGELPAKIRANLCRNQTRTRRCRGDNMDDSWAEATLSCSNLLHGRSASWPRRRRDHAHQDSCPFSRPWTWSVPRRRQGPFLPRLRHRVRVAFRNASDQLVPRRPRGRGQAGRLCCREGRHRHHGCGADHRRSPRGTAGARRARGRAFFRVLRRAGIWGGLSAAATRKFGLDRRAPAGTISNSTA